MSCPVRNPSGEPAKKLQDSQEKIPPSTRNVYETGLSFDLAGAGGYKGGMSSYV